MRHFLVVGAGYTGRRVVRLLPEGVQVLSRSTPSDLSAASRLVVTDLDNPMPLQLDTGGPLSVLYTVPPTNEAPDTRLQHLLNALQEPARFVYISTTGVYGDCEGSQVTETTPANPKTERARRRLAAEAQISAWCADHGARCFILRVPGIYGPGRLGLSRIEKGSAVIAEADANPGNRIHVDDLAEACRLAMQADAPAGIYNIGDGDSRSATWFTNTVARMAGLAAPPPVSRALAQQSFSRKRMSFLAESRRIDASKFSRAFGFSPMYANAEDGIRMSLAADESDQG